MPITPLTQEELKNIYNDINSIKDKIMQINDMLNLDPNIATTGALEHLKSNYQDSAYSHLTVVNNIIARNITH